MPFIQCDFQHGLSNAQKDELTEKIVDVVNKSIGSSRPHINVVIREWPEKNLVEAGKHARRYQDDEISDGLRTAANAFVAGSSW